MKQKGPSHNVRANPRTSVFLTEYALAMDLLQRDLSWNSRGHVVHRLTSDESLINEAVSMAFLKYYLDADGALLIEFAREVRKNKELVLSRFLNDSGVERIFAETAEKYLEHVFEIRDRSELRKLERLKSDQYKPGVRFHKSLPHIQPLADLGILERVQDNGLTFKGRMKSSEKSNHNYLESFLEEFSNFSDIDLALSPEGNFFGKVARIYDFHSLRKLTSSEGSQSLRRQIIKSYLETRNPVFKLAWIDSVADLTCIRLMFPPFSALVETSEVRKSLDEMRRETENGVRFHIDNWGREAYVVMSEEYTSLVPN